MKRRILALVLMLAMLLPCLAGEAAAATSGSCGKTAQWSFDAASETLTVSGTGALKDYNYTMNYPWAAVKDSVRHLVIQEGITEIGEFTFYGMESLQTVTLPESLKQLGSSAFNRCMYIQKIYYGGTREQRDALEFGWNDTLFCGVTWYYEGKKEFDYPVSGTCGKNLTWKFDKSTGKLTISGTGAMNNYQYIEYNMANRTTTSPWVNLPVMTLEIKSGVTSIGSNAFWFFKNLKKVTLPDSVQYIGDEAFVWCLGLEEIVFSDNTKSIGVQAFASCWNLKNVEIPDSVTYLGSGAFATCLALETVSLPKGITKIEDAMFADCKQLKEIVIPEKVTAIGEYAFSFASGLERVTFCAGVTDIEQGAFDSCKALKDVYYFGTEAQRSKISIEEENTSLQEATWHYIGPEAPVIKCSADADTGKPTLSWDKVPYAEKYRIYRATSKTGTYSYLATSTGTSYIDSSAVAGINYYYKVKALDTDTDTYSAYSNIVNRMCDLAKPVVSQTVNSTTGKPVVKWETVEGAAKYYVYRSTSKSSGYEKVYTGVKARKYEDADAVAGTNYYYKVMAVHEKSSANSAYSAVVNRVCDLAKPTVTLTLTDSGNPWVKWTAVEDADGYEVWRATSKSGTYKKVKTTVSGTSFADRDVKAGTKYYYKVRAIHDTTSANSAYSAIKYITAK